MLHFIDNEHSLLVIMRNIKGNYIFKFHVELELVASNIFLLPEWPCKSRKQYVREQLVDANNKKNLHL